MDKRLFSPQLATALTLLSPEDRSLLILYIFEERTYSELSEIMGCKPEALKKRLSRMKGKVRRILQDWREDEKWEEKKKTLDLKI